MAGQSLVDFAPDLNNRIDVIKFETNANSKVAELLTKGEVALNVTINVKDEIIAESQGSFYIASLLAYDVCLRSGIHETQNDTYEIEVSFELVKAEVWKRLARTFESRCERFCRGNGHNPGGRAPYLHVLRWLAQEKEWTLYLREAIKRNSSLKGSVLQIVEKDFLRRLIDGDSEISAVLHYNLSNEPLLTVEDPQFMFFIRNISWDTFSKQLGFVDASFPHRYDFALSFAGTDRVMAESLFNALTAREILVFYDKNEQHRIIAEDIEEYLAPIYKSEAQFVVCLLGPDYPNRIWTKIESDAFKGRFMKNAVIPIWFDSAPPGIFDASKKVGGLSFSYKADLGEQTNAFAETLAKKLFDSRQR